MKNGLQFIILLIISVEMQDAGATTPKVPWRFFTSGKYFETRVNAFEKGIRDFEKEKYQSASMCFRRSLTTTHKFNFPSYNNYAVSVAMIGNYEQALGLLRKSVKSGGDPVLADYNAFVCLMNSGKYPEALERLQAIPYYIVIAHPKEAGDCYLQNNMYKEAYDCLRFHIETDSSEVDHKEYSNASIAAWKTKDSVKAVEYISYAIELKPGIAAYWTQIGKYYLASDPDAAASSFKKAMALSDKNDPELLKGLGYSYLSSGKGDKAAEIFEQLISTTKKTNPDYFQALAISMLQTNQLKEALDNLKVLSQLRSYNQMDERIMGDVYLNLDSIEKARSHYGNALVFGMDPDAVFGMAIIHFLEDDLQKSMNCFLLIENRAPGYHMSAYAKFVKAMVYYASGRFDALASIINGGEYTKNKEAGRLLVSAMHSMAVYQYAGAKKLLRKAIKLEPDNVNLKLMHGILLFETGENKEAAGILEDALEIDTANVEVMNCLALTLSSMGNHEKALKYMEIVLTRSRKPRFYNNTSLVTSHMADDILKTRKDTAYSDSLYKKAIAYVDTALEMGASEHFMINKAICYYHLRDTSNWEKWKNAISSPFTLNNQATAAYYNGNMTSARELIEQAITASMGAVCPHIKKNKSILENESTTKTEEGPGFIYLFQSIPAILPAKHTFSYSFCMDIKVPEQLVHKYKLYKDLGGDKSGQPENDVAMIDW